jgi:GNAT superfamily N-acetyltransferase
MLAVMTSVLVRRAGQGDARSLAELLEHVHELHVAQRPSVFKPLEREAAERWFAETLTRPGVGIWLAEQGATALGYVFAFVRESPESIFCYARRWYELDQIAVAPDAREQGVAGLLVAAVRVAARDEGVTHVELATWALNPRAQTAFQRLGFTPRIVRFESALA